jgi:outer membrane lipoprotein-sorting protein
MKFISAFLLVLTTHISSAQTSPSAIALFGGMMDAMRNTKTCSFVISLKERIGGAYKESQYLVRMQAKPLKVYAYSINPDAGAEALYVEGKENGKALINPNKFPFVNLTLSLNNMLMRKHHHYTMLQSGFIYTHAILEKYIQREGSAFYKLWRQQPDTVIGNKKYHVLEMDHPGYGYTSYTVKQGETVTSIAEKILVNDHMILDLNKSISDYYDVKAGQTIRVPNSFARRLRFFVDPVTKLPLIQEMYDDKGLYNRVVFSSLVQNPEFGEQEFSRDNPKYGF